MVGKQREKWHVCVCAKEYTESLCVCAVRFSVPNESGGGTAAVGTER